jgi:hypothetical protein
MKKLLKEYNFDFEHQYYDMIIKSVVNGQIELFNTRYKRNSKLTEQENNKIFSGNFAYNFN